MADAEDDPAETLLDHAKSPFHRGILSGANCSHVERNPTCGDEVHLQLRIDGSRVAAAWFQGRGCIVSQAGASMLCEQIDGRSVDEVGGLTDEDVVRWIGIPLNPIRRNCGLLAFRALQQALAKLPS